MELLPLAVRVTEYQTAVRRCPAGGQRSRPALPPGMPLRPFGAGITAHQLATPTCRYGDAYADMDLEDQLVPGDHVAGKVVKFVWLLVWLVFPVALSRNWTMPPPGGTRRPIQYFALAAMSVAGISTVFHVPLRGVLILAWASRLPGVLLAVLA